MKLYIVKIVWIAIVAYCFIQGDGVFAANPFLPAWEYIPDGEPRVFGDRVYLYGSHDLAGSSEFCDFKLKVWSASLHDPNNWKDEGDSFHSRADEEHADDIPWSDNKLYAPDVVEKDGKYYLYFYLVGAQAGVAVSDSPAGPFKLLSKINRPEGSPPDCGGWGQFPDPGVLVDDDGTIYYYWGFLKSYMAQLDPHDMCTLLPGTYKEDIIPNVPPFRYFEAISPRKINGIYYIVYADGGILSYATCKSPTGPFVYGGPIVRNGWGSPGGNIHGSLCNMNGQWYVFYHRMTNRTITSRRACAEKITIEPDGSIKEVEQTSLGFQDSLDPYSETSADIACVLNGDSYVTEFDKETHPVVNNVNGSEIGYKYFEFGPKTTENSVTFSVELRKGLGIGNLELWIDAIEGGGKKIGVIDLMHSSTDLWETPSVRVEKPSGRHALYFRFAGNDRRAICDVKSFRFERK
jgi:arabinoxylan arabinofuranohydrolase